MSKKAKDESKQESKSEIRIKQESILLSLSLRNYLDTLTQEKREQDRKISEIESELSRLESELKERSEERISILRMISILIDMIEESKKDESNSIS